MKLTQKSTVWDIGTCTGSMAIEAAKLAPEGQVFAIEKNEPDLENCFQTSTKVSSRFYRDSWKGT